MTELGYLLKKWRLEHGDLSQKEAANICGIGKSTWAKIETGHTRYPCEDVVARIVSGTGLPIEVHKQQRVVRSTTPSVPKAPVDDATQAYIDAVHAWRVEHNIGVYALAKQLGVSHTTIHEFEGGRKRLPPVTMARVEKLTGIEPLIRLATREGALHGLESDGGDAYSIVRIVLGKEEVLFHSDSREQAKQAYTQITDGGALVRVFIKRSDGTRKMLPIYEAEAKFRSGARRRPMAITSY